MDSSQDLGGYARTVGFYLKDLRYLFFLFMVSTSCSFNNNFLLFRNSKDDFEVKVLCIFLLSDLNIPKEICIKIIKFLRLHLELLFSGGGGYFEREDLNR